MSLSAAVYLASMLLVFAGQRLFAGDETLGPAGTLVGLGGLVIAFALRLRALRAAGDPGQRAGHRAALVLLLVGCFSLVLYGLVSDRVVDALALEEQTEQRWLGVWRALWPIMWLVGSLPMVVVDSALHGSPVIVQPRRIRQAVEHGLVAAFGIALVFPLNFLATRHNERWDLAYIQTTVAGPATRAIAQALEEPVTVRVFQPPASEVEETLRIYFDSLEAESLTVEYLDQAAEPALARELKVRENGVIAVTRGEVQVGDEGEEDAPKPVTKTYKVGVELENAKRKLKKLDQEVQKLLLDVGQSERIVYVTTGHGELSWRGGAPPQNKARVLKKVLQLLGFSVHTIGLGDGLAEEIPTDADLVLVLGPEQPFLPAEVDSLERHLDAGGSVLVALEPEPPTGSGEATEGEEEDPLHAFVARLGLRMGQGMLAAEKGIVAVTRNKEDRLNLATDRFSAHESTSVLSKAGGLLFLFTPTVGHLEEVEEHEANVTVTVRSLASAWVDLDGNLELDADAGETKKMRSIAAASTGGKERPWRALVVADSGLLSDLAMGNRGNQQFAYDGLNWLIGAEAVSGAVEIEEDAKILHTKESQTIWFYGTVFGVPLLVLAAGVLRLRLRRKGGER
jgi:hypothetical protein